MKRFFLSVLALFVCAAAPLSAQSKKGAAVPSTDDYNQSQFWIGNFPEGQYVVHLSRIVAVAQHKYILDNTCMVYEVTLITLGNTPTKFYYLETLGQNSGPPSWCRGMSRISAFSRILAPIRISAPPQNSHHWRTQLMRMDDTISFAASISG